MPKLVVKVASSVIYKFESKISGWESVRFALFISNENTDNIIRIVKPIEDSGLLIDGATETAKYEWKQNKEGDLLVLW